MPNPSIKINKKTTPFFIAISKEGEHTFVMLGVYNNFQVQKLLCRVGKRDIEKPEDTCCTTSNTLYRLLFGKIKTALRPERLSRLAKEGVSDISYQAYDINYDQYLEFVAILAGLPKDYQLACYQPQSEQTDVVTMKYETVSYASNPHSGAIQKTSDFLNVTNTCRHTGIALIEALLHEKPSERVSSRFILNLPYKTQLKRGVPARDIPFYVLPPTPNNYSELQPKKKNALSKLYRRMEEMVLLRPNSLQTQQKFTLLKNLYQDIAGPQKDVSLDQLLFNIQQWKSNNKSLLGELRQKFIWDFFYAGRKTATVKLIEEIEAELGNNSGPCHPSK